MLNTIRAQPGRSPSGSKLHNIARHSPARKTVEKIHPYDIRFTEILGYDDLVIINLQIANAERAHIAQPCIDDAIGRFELRRTTIHLDFRLLRQYGPNGRR